MTSQWWVNFDFNMANINISSPKPKVSKHYGRSCVAGTYGGIRCMNTQFTKGVSFHYFPNNAKDLKRHQQWVRFVRRHRPEFKPSTYSSLCSVHFEDSCYSVPRGAALQFGVRAKLKDDAVCQALMQQMKLLKQIQQHRWENEDRYANFSNYCLIPEMCIFVIYLTLTINEALFCS